jgi:membrane protein DedA with SNARE-associated domain
VVPLFVFLFALACVRGSATYAVGRGLRGAADRRTRLAESDRVRRGEAIVKRYGAPAVALCFLTVGVQTATIGAAGSLRMPLRRFLPALAVGALIWATIYVTIGFTVVEAIWGGRTWVLLSAIATLALIAWAGAALRRKWSARKE